ncbi:siderophore-interacting protein [Stutzerimonas kirkiae]|uniref:siderophore-interacting protein n=1 Tax=Stutzerimonas kirkiae TaxID=2211392 RepID=UPI0010383701|nr:siderophore-interacting protein [Stutzerimonas kirkiae]TBV12880.1 NADPH-dependent ferric siderophore reductase [Stutzerimonas kirkiae]
MAFTTSLRQRLQSLIHRTLPARPCSYRVFDLRLKERILLSPSLARFVFTGPEVARMRTLAADQRVKLFFPVSEGTPPSLPLNGDWHKALRALEPGQRPAMRTYTIRALRNEAAEVDVEFVLHGDNGPASRWAEHAVPGDRLQMVAPDAAFAGDPGGYEWQPPAGARHILLIGDETALPAIAGILENLADAGHTAVVQTFIEVPEQADRRELVRPASAQVVWLPRNAHGLGHGEGMQKAARELAVLPLSTAQVGKPQPLGEVDIETQVLWELAQPNDSEFYAWIAGESAAVMSIRRYLVGERGLERKAMSFMGYWRLGRALE